MPCLNCRSSYLHESSHLSQDERNQSIILLNVQSFVLCKSCGNVMMKNTEGRLMETTNIHDVNIVTMSFNKLFGQDSSFSGIAATHYSLEEHGEKISTTEFQSLTSLSEYSTTREAVDKTLEEPTIVEGTYSHVDNYNEARSFFSRVHQFMGKMLTKIFKKAS